MFHTGVGVYPHFPNEKKEKKEKKTTRKYVITFTRSTGNIFGDYSLKFRVTPFFSSPHCLSSRSQTLPLARLSPRYPPPPALWIRLLSNSGKVQKRGGETGPDGNNEIIVKEECFAVNAVLQLRTFILDEILLLRCN